MTWYEQCVWRRGNRVLYSTAMYELVRDNMCVLNNACEEVATFRICEYEQYMRMKEDTALRL